MDGFVSRKKLKLLGRSVLGFGSWGERMVSWHDGARWGRTVEEEEEVSILLVLCWFKLWNPIRLILVWIWKFLSHLIPTSYMLFSIQKKKLYVGMPFFQVFFSFWISGYSSIPASDRPTLCFVFFWHLIVLVFCFPVKIFVLVC